MAKTVRRKNSHEHYDRVLWRYDAHWYNRWYTPEQAHAHLLECCRARNGHSDLKKAAAKELAQFHADRGSSRQRWPRKMMALHRKMYRRAEKQLFDRVRYLEDHDDAPEFDRRIHYRCRSWY